MQFGVSIVDVDGDGYPDIVADATSVVVLRGFGNGVFADPVLYDAGPVGNGASVVMDLDNDGRPDVMQAAASPSVGFSRLHNNGCEPR